jgi:hypothetical protein
MWRERNKTIGFQDSDRQHSLLYFTIRFTKYWDDCKHLFVEMAVIVSKRKGQLCINWILQSAALVFAEKVCFNANLRNYFLESTFCALSKETDVKIEYTFNVTMAFSFADLSLMDKTCSGKCNKITLVYFYPQLCSVFWRWISRFSPS